MNELELIRNQLRAERSRAIEVAAIVAAAEAAAASGGAPLRQASVDYLVLILTRFEERDQLLLERNPSGSLSAMPGASREALSRLEVALGSEAPQSWGDFLAFVDGPWRARRDAFDSVLEGNPRVTDWRAVSFVNADSILDERARYARVQSARRD
ncbi:MAG TPA: hypothetical protein VGM84_09535 [Steroidobacteraceae bacterium]|jgi:hypothetical protein